MAINSELNSTEDSDMHDLIERAILADKIITRELRDEDTSLVEENYDPPLSCWLTCESPLCYSHGCRNALNNKGVQS